MHHFSLDRPGPDQGHLDHQVVVVGWLHARQHGHLRPRFDLEHTDGVGGLDHGVSRRVVGRDGRRREFQTLVLLQQGQALADAGQHAQRQAIHLEQAERFQVVLVPLDDGALGHRGVFHRHQVVQRLFGDDEAAGVLGQVPRRVEQLARDREHASQHRTVGVEAALAQAFVQRLFAIPPGEHAGQLVELVGGQAQCPGHVAHRALAAVADHRCCQRGALAAVLAVEVLDHLLAPLVLEVHVNVRRLVALLRDEALEQHAHPRRVHLGDAQRKADRGVGGRAAALAQDALRARVLDDVMDGEEESFVLQFRHQLQFVLDLLSHLVRLAFGPAPTHAAFGQHAQPAAGRVAVGHQLARVFVLQIVEAEAAASGDAQRFGEQRFRVNGRQRGARTQVALAVGEQVGTGLEHGAVVADGGERVLDHAPAARMHVRVAAGDGGNVEPVGQREQHCQAGIVVRTAMQFHRQPQPVDETRSQPFGVFAIGRRARDPQGQRPGQAILQIDAGQQVLAFGGAPPALRDQLADGRISVLILGKQHQLESIVEHDLGTDDQRHAGFARGFQRAHDAGQGALVGDRQCGVAIAACAFEQLARA